MRAPDAAAQLVQLREAELVGAVDHDRVGGRDVDAGLDDGRAQQQLWRCCVNSRITRSSSRSRNLAVRIAMRASGSRRRAWSACCSIVSNLGCAGSRPGPPRLSRAGTASRISPVGPWRDEGLDREPVLRRGGDHREARAALQRQRERAWESAWR
jgi:hypothetical protein